jgi:hypothetical protein
MEIVFPTTELMISVNLTDATTESYMGAFNASETKGEIMNKNTYAQTDSIGSGVSSPDGEIQSILDPEEVRITARVETLWKKHEDGKVKQKHSQETLKKIRVELAERLSELKSIHSRPGRAGNFSTVLKTIGIPRSTANRLVSAFENIAAKDASNCPTGTITGELTFEEAAKKVRQLSVATWSRVRKHVTSAELLAEYIDEFNNVADAALNQIAEAKSPAPGKTPATEACVSEMAAAA